MDTSLSTAIDYASVSDVETQVLSKKTPHTSTLVSRNLLIGERRTSVRLEPDMWSALSNIVRREGRSAHSICTLVNEHKPADTTLTAAIRVFIMTYFLSAATEEGHARAGHGYGNVIFIEKEKTTSRLTLNRGTNGMAWR